MRTLKGQNLRIIEIDESPDESSVIAFATSCSITLGTNTEDSSTKDDPGDASKPEVISKNWSVSIDTLSVLDSARWLMAVKNGTPLKIVWDETSTTDNQTPEAATFQRGGNAIVNDVTFNFNDRENSTTNIQMTGIGEVSVVPYAEQMAVLPAQGAYTKGQFVRLFLSSDNTATPAKVIAGAKSLSLHISATLESSTTKDTTGDWDVQEVTGISYDISTNALVRAGGTITSQVQAQDLNALEQIYEAGTPVKWQIANVSGANQRTKGSIIASGSAILSQLTINAQNRQAATYDAQLTGYGDISISS